MIIVGYPGIGKTTLAAVDKRIIDLESGCFFTNSGERPDNWYVFYCNLAEDLSKQGFIVLTSSHEVVRTRLKKYSKEPLALIYPVIRLRRRWNKKLEKRYKLTKPEKDKRAWESSQKNYVDNIRMLQKETNFEHFLIKRMNYNLENIIMEGMKKYESKTIKQ